MSLCPRWFRLEWHLLGIVAFSFACGTPSSQRWSGAFASEEHPFEFALTLREIDFEVETEMVIEQVSISADLTESDLFWDNYRDANPRLDWRWDDVHVTLGIVGSEQDSLQDLPAVVLGFPTTLVDVATSLEFSAESLVITKDLAESDSLEVGAGFGINHAKYSVGATNAALVALGAAIQESKSMVFPTLAFRVGWLEQPFSGELMLQWISYDNETLSDIDLQLTYQLVRYRESKSPAGYLSVGYHKLVYETDYASGGFDFDTSFTFKGPWVGFTLPF